MFHSKNNIQRRILEGIQLVEATARTIADWTQESTPAPSTTHKEILAPISGSAPLMHLIRRSEKAGYIAKSVSRAKVAFKLGIKGAHAFQKTTPVVVFPTKEPKELEAPTVAPAPHTKDKVQKSPKTQPASSAETPTVTTEEESNWGGTLLTGAGLGIGIGAVVVYGKYYLIRSAAVLAGQQLANKVVLPGLSRIASQALAKITGGTLAHKSMGTAANSLALSLHKKMLNGLAHYLGGPKSLTLSLASTAVGAGEAAMAIFQNNGQLTIDAPANTGDFELEEIEEADTESNETDGDGEDRYEAIRSWLESPPLSMQITSYPDRTNINLATGVLLEHFADLDDEDFRQNLEDLQDKVAKLNHIIDDIFSPKVLMSATKIHDLKVSLFCKIIYWDHRAQMFSELEIKSKALQLIAKLDKQSARQLEFWDDLLIGFTDDLIEMAEHNDLNSNKLLNLMKKIDWGFKILENIHKEGLENKTRYSLIREIINSMSSPQTFPDLFLKIQESLVYDYTDVLYNGRRIKNKDTFEKRVQGRVCSFNNNLHSDLRKTQRAWKLVVDSIHEHTVLNALNSNFANTYPGEWDSLKLIIARETDSSHPRRWAKKVARLRTFYITHSGDIGKILDSIQRRESYNFDALLDAIDESE